MGAKRHVESDVRPRDEDGTAQEDRSRWAGVAAARRVAKARETCVLDQFNKKMRETPENITRVGNSEAQGHCSGVEQDTDDRRRQVTRARDKDLAKFEMEKARVCCVQEHSTQALASTRLASLTVEQTIVAVCRLCMGQLKDDTCSYYLGYWALFVDAKNFKTDRQMRIRLRLSTDVAEEDNGERFIG